MDPLGFKAADSHIGSPGTEYHEASCGSVGSKVRIRSGCGCVVLGRSVLDLWNHRAGCGSALDW